MIKRTIFVAAAMALFCNSASSVELLKNDKGSLELSGYADIYVEYLHESGADGSKARLSSGGLSTSRVSLHGDYDLEPGLEAFFRVGTSFSIDDGELSNELRQGYVGLRGDWGAVSFGKQFTTAYDPVGYADPNWTSAYSMMNNMVWYYAPYEKDNSIVYESPTFSGFSGSLMYAFGDEGSKDGRFFGAALKYSNGPLFVSLISEKEYSKDLANPNKIRHSWNNYLAVVYRLGSVVPTFVFHTYDGYYSYPPYVGFESKGWATQLGVRWHVNDNNMIHFSYVHREDNSSNKAIGTADGFTAGIIHNLSEQTDVYVLVAHVWNDENAKNPYPVTWTGDALPIQGQNPTGIAFGIRYEF